MDMNIQIGLPGSKIGYGTTKKPERFTDEAVLIMEKTELKEGQTKVVRKFTLSKKAQELLGLKGKDYEETKSAPHETITLGHTQNENGEVVYLLLNTTGAEVGGPKSLTRRFAKQGTFSNNSLHDALIENFGIDANDECVFTTEQVTGENITVPIVAILARKAVDESDAKPDPGSQPDDNAHANSESLDAIAHAQKEAEQPA